MPGWHNQTKDLVTEGKLQVFGIAPEQYGDRMALFLQWKNLEFPVLMDPLNVLNVSAVPITLLVDESGVIRYRNPKPRDLKVFLDKEYPETARVITPASPLGQEQALRALQNRDTAEIERAATMLALLSTSNKNPEFTFQSGVLARWLFDNGGDPENFQTAVHLWSDALAHRPGQYIWRRRIQQYGPRLDKPYPFYNWVIEARKDLQAAGKTPHPLQVEPSGSEVAAPRKKGEQGKESPNFPDPNNKLPHENALLEITTTTIPHTDAPEKGRLHLLLTPTENGHWSSDAQKVELWFRPEEGSPIFLTSEATSLPANLETSSLPRVLEGDFSLPQNSAGKLVLFYSLCETENAVCRFLKTEWKFHQ
ncbi:MAG: TlpA family protein disulfide reductase [Roseibacillus sp.]